MISPFFPWFLAFLLLIACVALGQLLLTALPRVPSLRPFIPEQRLVR